LKDPLSYLMFFHPYLPDITKKKILNKNFNKVFMDDGKALACVKLGIILLDHIQRSLLK
jgi:hypothetical protein